MQNILHGNRQIAAFCIRFLHSYFIHACTLYLSSTLPINESRFLPKSMAVLATLIKHRGDTCINSLGKKSSGIEGETDQF